MSYIKLSLAYVSHMLKIVTITAAVAQPVGAFACGSSCDRIPAAKDLNR